MTRSPSRGLQGDCALGLDASTMREAGPEIVGMEMKCLELL